MSSVTDEEECGETEETADPGGKKNSDDSDDESFQLLTRKKSNKSAMVFDSDDEDEDNEDIDENKVHSSISDLAESKNISTSSNPPKKADDIAVDDSSEDEPPAPVEGVSTVTSKEKTREWLDKELFDDGVDCEEETMPDNNADSDSDDDDDDGPMVMSAALKKRLSQGASKKPKHPSTKKQQNHMKENLDSLHSESQRIIRESSTSIPYHKPKKVDLSVFLARSKQKQEQFEAIKSKPGFSWKNSPDLALLCKRESRKSDISSDEPGSLMDRISSNLPELHIPRALHSNSQKDSRCDTGQSSSTAHNTAEITPSSEKPLEDNECTIEMLPVTDECVTGDAPDNTKTDHLNIVKKNTNDKPEQDSGYLSVPCNTSEEDSSSDSAGNKAGCEEQPNNNLTNKSPDATPDSDTIATLPEMITESNTFLHKTQLTPKLANLSVTQEKPSLSGSPNSFIDFDDSSSTPLPTGISLLMNRLVKHSKSATRKSKKVEVSVVSKETTELGDKEELKIDKITFQTDEADETDPSLAKPGAKLSALKVKLQMKMKIRREEARQKRCEMYEMDNEEGFDHEEEEEIEEEMSEDSEDEEDEEAEEEEEMDADGYTVKEKSKKERNPFVDEEAEDEEEEDENDDAGTDILDEGELHLALDTMESDSEDIDDKPRTDFLSAALKKTQTLELFDEDANTESPTVSQRSNPENIEISDRPFIQLSGSSTVKAMSPECKLTSAPKLQEESLCLTNNSSSTSMSTASTEDSKLTEKEESTVSSSSMFQRDRSSLGGDSSFDLISAGQRVGCGQTSRTGTSLSDRATPDLFTPSSKSSLCNTNSKSVSKLLDASPMEDTQDLLRYSPLQSQAESTPRICSQSFHFNLNEDSESQMLDEDGLLKEKSGIIKPARRQLVLDNNRREVDQISTQDNMDQLLGLCSGTFSEGSSTGPKTGKTMFGLSQIVDNQTQGSSDAILDLCSGRFTGPLKESDEKTNSSSLGGLFCSQQPRNTQAIMDEMEGLCSGQFTTNNQQENKENTQRMRKKRLKGRRRLALIQDDDSDEDDFDVTEGENNDADNERLESDDEFEPIDSEDEMAAAEKGSKSQSMFTKNGKLKKAFFDEEAELSGSDFESDEDLDISLKDDFLEREAGDDDEMLPEEELRNQVGRVHLKSIIDQDKKDIMMMQERFLADGDLHAEGSGRLRRYRWRNVDDDTQQDMFGGSDDELQHEEVDADEEKWRLERFQREKFLKEQKESETERGDEGTELLKLGSVVYKSKKASRLTPVNSSQKSPDVSSSKQSQPSNSVEKPALTSPNIFKLSKKHHGSFLKRSQHALAKMAEMTKPVGNVNGPRHSKNFVFTAVSPEEKTSETSVKPQVKRTMSVQPKHPAVKRPRLDRSNSLPRGSIFHHF